MTPTPYGPEFYQMGFGEAVDGGYLTDYQVLVIRGSRRFRGGEHGHDRG